MAFGGWPFVVHSIAVDESVSLREYPADYVRRISREKARATYHSVKPNQPLAGSIIVSADTAVVLKLQAE